MTPPSGGLSVLALGMSNLKRSLSFHRDGLGLPTAGISGREFEHGAGALFDLSGGLKLAIWAQADIAHDIGLPVHPINSTAMTIGHNVAYPEDADGCMKAAAQAGAEAVKPAQDTFSGAVTLANAVTLTGIFGKSSGPRFASAGGLSRLSAVLGPLRAGGSLGFFTTMAPAQCRPLY